MIKYAGTSDFIEQPPKRRFRSGTGWSRVRIWRGPKNKCDDFLNAQIAIGGVLLGALNLEVEEEAEGYAIVTADFAVEGATGTQSTTPADPISRKWTLQGNDVQASVWALPWVQRLLRTKSAGDLSEISKLMEQGLTEGKTFSFADVEMEMLFILLASKEESFDISQQVLRKVETVSVLSSIKAAHQGVNRIYLYDQLIAAEPTLDAAALIDAAGLKDYAWKKGTPTVDEVSRGQYQITQEYLAVQEADPWIYKGSIDTSKDWERPGDPEGRLRR